MATFSILAMTDENFGIGLNDYLPWNSPPLGKLHMKLLLATDDPFLDNAVIIGRKTWDAQYARYKAFGKRCVVITGNAAAAKHAALLGVSAVPSYDAAFTFISEMQNIERVFIVGGASIFTMAMQDCRVQELTLIRIQAAFECNVTFPTNPLLEYWVTKEKTDYHNLGDSLRVSIEKFKRD
jgi:dihydrofolate reductase